LAERESFEDDLGKLARLIIDTVSWHVFVEFEVSEPLEDLLESGLTDRVVFKLVLLLELLDELEEEADRPVMALDTQSHVTAVVLDHLHVHELAGQRLDNAEQGTLHENVLSDFVKGEWLLEDLLSGSFFVTIILLLGVKMEDRLDDDARDLGLCQNLRGFLSRELRPCQSIFQSWVLQVLQSEDSVTDFFDFVLNRHLGFYFYDKAGSELVFDMLGGSEALEDASFDHDTHLG